ncbi:MAG: hypothetical protein EP303_05920 [Deltaproteobacteria bacterium]|nr:MAG: hypothetical protein EP303_05920 [Deltaproteobacteria bacterium]UCF48564.1 MAG: hypothetical protein JSU89_15595 [Myxococcales bacterium]
MLINVYILSLVLGAVLLAASIFLSEKRVDSDDQTRAHDDTTRPSQFGQLDGVAGGDFFARTVRSRRFWTFFVSFFGMTGLVLDGLDLMGPAVSLVVALGIGTIAGAGASAAVRIGSS